MNKIISIHVPKAGGTSTLTTLKQAYGDDHVLEDYGSDPGNPISPCNLDPEGWLAYRPINIPENIIVVHGHFKAQKYDLVKDAFRFTMLRHPLDNVISIYCYWRAIPPQPSALHQYFCMQNMTVIEFAKLPLIRNLYGETYFGGWDMKRLDFIGRHETRSHDLQRLGRLLGIDIDTSVHLNVTPSDEIEVSREKILGDRKVCAQLMNILAEDIRFYEMYAI